MRQRRIESFLLRLVVQEDSTLSPEVWHGRIQHVGSGHERQFEQLDEIVSFICEQFNGDHALHIISGDSQTSLTEQ